MRPRPVLRYHGGKWLLAPWIISHFGPHRVYVEPFGGAASVLMRKKRSPIEVYNDRWGTVVNVFRVLRDPATAAELARMLYLTPFARDEFEGVMPSEFGELSNVEQARYTVLRSLAGFGSASNQRSARNRVPGDECRFFDDASRRLGQLPNTHLEVRRTSKRRRHRKSRCARRDTPARQP